MPVLCPYDFGGGTRTTRPALRQFPAGGTITIAGRSSSASGIPSRTSTPGMPARSGALAKKKFPVSPPRSRPGKELSRFAYRLP